MPDENKKKVRKEKEKKRKIFRSAITKRKSLPN